MNQKQTALLLGLHCHQPVDNFHHVLDEAIEKSYHPFFEVASAYKDFKFSVHYSGWLLAYIKEKAPETFALMQTLSDNGQIEFLTGGFYEPILASISSADRIAQITKLNDFIEEHFGQTPKGLWLTERVWDSVIIKDLAACGIEYVVVDDYHFISSGFDKDKLGGYFITEDEGVSLKIFPINKELRYTMPFAKPEVVCNYLESIADDEITAGVIFDDGEKFGIWPETYEWVYEKGWLKAFIEKSLSSSAIKPMLYKEYLESCKPISLAYLPITSYVEMGEWSLHGKDTNIMKKMQNAVTDTFGENTCEKFVKGSVWKNFLVKYYEANKIQKRYLALSNDRIENDDYLESLYKAQTNDVLWHGVFGGTYLPNLRDNAYRFIIDCENIKYFKQTLTEVQDINLDGYDEIKCISENLIALFDTKLGGQLIEFDIRDRSWNLANTMSRYYEAYHDKVIHAKKVVEADSPEKEISEDAIATIHGANGVDLHQYKEILKHDWHTKNSFVDHIVNDSVDLEHFAASSFDEYGDFANQPFELLSAKEQKVSMQRKGGLYINGAKKETTLEKNFFVDDNNLSFDIAISGANSENLSYLLEHNFHFANLKDIMIDKQPFAKDIMIAQADTLSIYDAYTQKTIKLSFSKKCDIFITRLDTLSQSEAGFDLTNQGLSLGFLTKLSNNFAFDGTIEVV